MAHLLGHMQVMSLQWIPFYVLFLLRALDSSRKQRRWLRDACMAGLFLVFNGLSDWYFVLYLFLFTVLVMCYLWLSDRFSDWACGSLQSAKSRRGRSSRVFAAADGRRRFRGRAQPRSAAHGARGGGIQLHG